MKSHLKKRIFKFSVEEKLHIIEEYKHTRNLKEVCDKYNIKKFNIRYWLENEQKFRQNSKKNKLKTIHSGPLPKIKINENLILDYLHKKDQENIKIDTKFIKTTLLNYIKKAYKFKSNENYINSPFNINYQVEEINEDKENRDENVNLKTNETENNEKNIIGIPSEEISSDKILLNFIYRFIRKHKDILPFVLVRKKIKKVKSHNKESLYFNQNRCGEADSYLPENELIGRQYKISSVLKINTESINSLIEHNNSDSEGIILNSNREILNCKKSIDLINPDIINHQAFFYMNNSENKLYLNNDANGMIFFKNISCNYDYIYHHSSKENDHIQNNNFNPGIKKIININNFNNVKNKKNALSKNKQNVFGCCGKSKDIKSSKINHNNNIQLNFYKKIYMNQNNHSTTFSLINNFNNVNNSNIFINNNCYFYTFDENLYKSIFKNFYIQRKNEVFYLHDVTIRISKPRAIYNTKIWFNNLVELEHKYSILEIFYFYNINLGIFVPIMIICDDYLANREFYIHLIKHINKKLNTTILKKPYKEIPDYSFQVTDIYICNFNKRIKIKRTLIVLFNSKFWTELNSLFSLDTHRMRLKINFKRRTLMKFFHTFGYSMDLFTKFFRKENISFIDPTKFINKNNCLKISNHPNTTDSFYNNSSMNKDYEYPLNDIKEVDHKEDEYLYGESYSSNDRLAVNLLNERVNKIIKGYLKNKIM